ncbi:TPA: hypothetical protein ACH3X1_012819 [Trebouxia sp. C0004]
MAPVRFKWCSCFKAALKRSQGCFRIASTRKRSSTAGFGKSSIPFDGAASPPLPVLKECGSEVNKQSEQLPCTRLRHALKYLSFPEPHEPLAILLVSPQ